MAHVQLEADTTLPTDFGQFHLYLFHEPEADSFHYVVTYGNITEADEPLVRIQSACFTSELFRATNCECRLQLDQAMEKIVEHGAGAVIHLAQDGRGNGPVAKVRAMKLVLEEGYDTHDAYVKLGYPVDPRNFGVVAEIIRSLNFNQPIQLMTANPDKINDVKQAGIEVSTVTDLYIEPDNEFWRIEQETKVKKMGHIDPKTQQVDGQD